MYVADDQQIDSGLFDVQIKPVILAGWHVAL